MNKDLARLAREEQRIGNLILVAESNFKKDSSNRKTNPEYFSRRIHDLDIFYSEFVTVSNQIDIIDPDHGKIFRQSVLDTYAMHNSKLNSGLAALTPPIDVTTSQTAQSLSLPVDGNTCQKAQSYHSEHSNDGASVHTESDDESLLNQGTAKQTAVASPFQSSYANLVHANNISKFIQGKSGRAGEEKLKAKLKLTSDKLDEVLKERDDLISEKNNILPALDKLKRENTQMKRELEHFRSESISHDEMVLEIEELRSNYASLKNNFLRVSREKVELQRSYPNNSNSKNNYPNFHGLDPRHNRHTNRLNRQNRTDSDSENELFSIKEIIKLIPKFNGNIADLRVYINKCTELWTHVKSPMDQTKFVTVLKNNLQGDAALVLLDEDNLNDWDSIKKILNDNFNPDPNHSNHTAVLQGMKQGETESVEHFCERIRTILNKLKSSIPIGATKQFWFEHNERQAIQAMEDGLFDVKLQSRVVSAQKATFNTASHFAIETYNRLKTKNLNSASPSASNVSNKPKPAQENSGAKPKIICRYCKKPGHEVETCSILKKKKDDQNKSEAETFKCSICNKNNHTTEICFKNPANKQNTEKKDKTANTLTAEDALNDDCEYQLWLEEKN